MEKKVYVITLLLIALLIISCDKDVVDPLKDKGTIFVDSNPEKAAIYIDGKSTGKLTPGVVEVIAGIHHGAVKKDGYADANFTAKVTVGNEYKVPPLDMFKYGILKIKTEPEQAEIWIDNDYKSDSPNSFSLADGGYSILLKYDEYKDTTLAINIANARDTVLSVNLQPTFVSKFYGKILWDTTNAANNHPSGIQLSTGRLLTIKAGTGESKIVDLFFAPDGFGGFIVRAANGVNGMERSPRFKVSKSTNINDGINSPIEGGTWTNSFLASENSYVFIYDNDGHYSKFQIVRRFENPARIEVKWIYNDRNYDGAF